MGGTGGLDEGQPSSVLLPMLSGGDPKYVKVTPACGALYCWQLVAMLTLRGTPRRTELLVRLVEVSVWFVILGWAASGVMQRTASTAEALEMAGTPCVPFQRSRVPLPAVSRLAGSTMPSSLQQ